MLIGEVTQNLAIKTILSIVPTYSIGRWVSIFNTQIFAVLVPYEWERENVSLIWERECVGGGETEHWRK